MVARVLSSKPAEWAGAALAALSAVPFIGHFVAPPSLAERNPGRTNNGAYYHAWWERAADGFNVPIRTRANILVRDVYVGTQDPPGPNTFQLSTRWVMLNLSDDTRWSQIGWIERPGNVRNTVIQYWKPGASAPTTELKPA